MQGRAQDFSKGGRSLVVTLALRGIHLYSNPDLDMEFGQLSGACICIFLKIRVARDDPPPTNRLNHIKQNHNRLDHANYNTTDCTITG